MNAEQSTTAKHRYMYTGERRPIGPTDKTDSAAMRLTSLEFSEHEGTPQEWTISDLRLGPRTLIVGRNASGKSRTLSVIYALSNYILGLRPPARTGTIDAEFLDRDQKYRYYVKVKNEKVIEEKFELNGISLLTRGEGGFGSIYTDTEQKPVAFQSPTNFFAVATRRDSVQHAFLEVLHTWASSVRYFQFGSLLGKQSLAFFTANGQKLDERDQDQVAAVFANGRKAYEDKFVEAIKADMALVGYDIETLELGAPTTFSIDAIQNASLPDPSALRVKESDLPGITDQFSMSQGMYRVLAVLVHLNFLQLRQSVGCLLIDDVGEGLDFERSCQLIKLLRKKTENTDLQLIISSNDRFVMNDVPLEEWAILIRRKNHVTVRNYENSAGELEDLEFTGLSNFSLYEMGLLDNKNSQEN
jgi:hypothetical protein